MGGRIRLQLMVDDFMMRLRQLIPVLFSGPRAEKPNRYTTEKAIAIPLARCAAVLPPPPLTDVRSSWQGGSFAPRCIPRTRAFRPWTRPKALRPLDFRPGGVSPSGHPTMGAFLPRLDPQTEGDFALPLDTHRPGFRSHGPRQGFAPLEPASPCFRGYTPRGRKPSVNST